MVCLYLMFVCVHSLIQCMDLCTVLCQMREISYILVTVCVCVCVAGDIQAEEQVLEWLIEQRHEDTIENINRQMLYTLIDTQDYLAVYFCKSPSCHSSFLPTLVHVLSELVIFIPPTLDMLPYSLSNEENV